MSTTEPLLEHRGEGGAPIGCPPHLQALYRACCAAVVARHYEHELRNALGAISSSVFFLGRRLAREENLWIGDPRIAAALARIDARVKDAARGLPDRVITLGSDPLQLLLLGDIATNLLAQLRAPANVRIDLLTTDREPVLARKDEVSLLLYCLIENAVEAASAGGHVHVRVYEGTVEVEDDGPGLSPEAFEGLARPFETTKSGGLGLGCGVARLLAKNLGATLELTTGRHGGLARVRVRGRES